MGISSIDGRLVSALTGISGKSTSAQKIRATEPNSDATNNRIKIRDTSDTFARAAQRISSAGGYVQISRDIVSALKELVDKTIKVVEKSASAASSESQRRLVDREYKKLKGEFADLVRKADVDGINLLTKEGIESVLEAAGLSGDTAASIAKAFNSLKIAKDGSLVDTSTKTSKKGGVVATQPGNATETFVRKVASRNLGEDSPTPIFAHQDGVVFQDDDDPTFQTINGTDTAIFVNNLHSTQALQGVASDIRLLATSEVSGYSVVESNQDFFGYNPDSLNQLFLVNKDGGLVSQITNFAINTSIESADISTDGLKVAFVTKSDFLGVNPDESDEVYVATSYELEFGGLSGKEFYNISDMSEGGNIISGVKISESGRYVNFDADGIGNQGGETLKGIVIYDLEKGAADLSQAENGRRVLAIDSNGLSYNITRSTVQVFSYSQDTGDTLEFEPGKFSSNHAVSEDGYLVFRAQNGNIRWADLTQGSTAVSNLVYANQAGESLTKLSITKLASADPRIIAAGKINPHGTLNQAFIFDTNEQNIKASSIKADKVDGIFDYSLKNRANAIKALEELKSIKAQLNTNMQALDLGLEAVRANLELSLAFSESLSAVSQTERLGSADKVAASIRQKILSYGVSTEALSQISNLEEIAAAVLV